MKAIEYLPQIQRTFNEGGRGRISMRYEIFDDSFTVWLTHHIVKVTVTHQMKLDTPLEHFNRLITSTLSKLSGGVPHYAS